MNKAKILCSMIAALLIGALAAQAVAQPGKARPPKKKTYMTGSEISSIVSYAPDVQAARSRVKRTKQAINDLADNISANEQSGGDLLKQPGTRRVINNAINAHGEALRAEASTIKVTTTAFMQQNNVVELPREPTGPPPPAPPPRPQAGTAAAAIGTTARAPGQALGVPASPPPTRRDTRPPGGESQRRVRFKQDF